MVMIKNSLALIGEGRGLPNFFFLRLPLSSFLSYALSLLAKYRGLFVIA
jgi:hypothetical protein